jgi:lysine-specific demethylase 8
LRAGSPGGAERARPAAELTAVADSNAADRRHAARGHPHDRATPIEAVESITPKRFRADYVRPGRPLMITGMATRWPAADKWSFDFFRRQSGAQVCIERGNVMQRSTSFDRVDFATYVDQVLDAQAGNAYLSLFEIFKIFPHLKQDVDFSLLAGQKLVNEVVGWLGPAGTVTGYHIDWADNLFAQIAGRKRFYLVSPGQTACMYPSSKYDWFSCLSEVDPRSCDARTHPLFERADPQTALLEPGDMCFIPRGWWHYVESLDCSISVNNFGLDLRALLTDGAREVAKAALHQLGLYRRECTCHMDVDGKRVKKTT